MTALRSDAARNRQRLLEAAETVFAEHGLDAGVEEVARVAGVGIGTLYRRFPTKDALIAELVRELLTEIHDLALSSLEAADGDGLETFLYATAAAQATHRGCLARLWDDEQTAQLKTVVRSAVGKLLSQAQANGRVRPDATLADLDLVFWSLRGIIEAAGPHEILWRRHLSLVIAGLRPDGMDLPQPAISERRLRSIKQAASTRQ
jgi:AcrR family transcriptional regulator